MGKRTKKIIAKNKKKEYKINMMIDHLKKKTYGNEIKFSCTYCLVEAYNSEINNTIGYVTDEELIESSNNKLRHK